MSTNPSRPYALPNGSIGWKEEFKPEDLVGKIVSGETGAVFENDDDYINHISPISGFTPADPEFNGPAFKLVQEGALARGEARKEDE